MGCQERTLYMCVRVEGQGCTDTRSETVSGTRAGVVGEARCNIHILIRGHTILYIYLHRLEANRIQMYTGQTRIGPRGEGGWCRQGCRPARVPGGPWLYTYITNTYMAADTHIRDSYTSLYNTIYDILYDSIYNTVLYTIHDTIYDTRHDTVYKFTGILYYTGQRRSGLRVESEWYRQGCRTARVPVGPRLYRV